MANGQMIGEFSDLEQQAWESGNSNSQNKPTNASPTSSPLTQNPYLNSFVQGGEIKILRPGEQPNQPAEQPRIEVSAYKVSMSAGTMKVDRETMSIDYRLQQLKAELGIKVEEEAEGQRDQETRSSELKTAPQENALQKQTEKVAKTAFTVSQKASQGMLGFFKELFGAFKALYKEVAFKQLTPEQKKKQDEEKKKNAERGSVKNSFFQQINENSRNLLMENMQKLNELEDRLQIAGMSTEERNKYLGRRRNASYAERNLHLAHFIARGMNEEREAQESHDRQIKAAQTSKSAGIDLNKIAEGGSILSSTGGQGAG